MMKLLFTLILLLLSLAPAVLAKGPITVYLAGDSTMAEKLPEKRPETGWGERLQQLFDSDKVKIAYDKRGLRR